MSVHGAACGFAATGAVPVLPDSIRANEVLTAIRCSGAPAPVSTCALVVLVPFAFSRTNPLSFSPNFTSMSGPRVWETAGAGVVYVAHENAAAGRITGDLAADQHAVDLPPPFVRRVVVVEPDLYGGLAGRLRDRDLLDSTGVSGLRQDVGP